jgi:hypothetical protein
MSLHILCTLRRPKKLLVLKQIFEQVMPPNILHSNCGREFIAIVIKELAEKYQIKLINCGPYHPQFQEYVEQEK